ncbi:hypothetical protein Pcinc_003902 [Petrolisthes cinctipes]|uniref:Uncharacterized protein n=1 Tax=Petrolisthes cinctipes TaxID=88211 RepID=A0AAE1L0S0_PETCI|nr:hypothetical protein Pcinc_003902 [Petrolisthes cinctipes]
MEEAEAAAAVASQEQPRRALTATNLPQCMDLLSQAMKIIEENYPNVERSTAVTRGVMSKLACYEVLLKEKNQQSITTFFQADTPKTVMELDTDPDWCGWPISMLD